MLADPWLPGATGTELLARVRQLHPSARRVLLIAWGDQASLEPMLEATVLGDIDAYVVRPGPPPDERFHRFVTEQLDEWGRSNLPGLEVVRVVGEEWAPRSHELRELLGRNGVPFGFYPAGSPDGQRLLAEAGAAGSALPAVVLFDGRVLPDPSNAEVAQAIGVQTKPGERALRRDRDRGGAGRPGRGGLRRVGGPVHRHPGAGGDRRPGRTSSLIRNYLGFPTGVSGGDLAVRAYTQALELRRGVRVRQPG